MTDSDIENVYKSNINVSHYAALRAVFDAGFDAGAGLSAQATAAGDPSLTQAPPVVDPTVTTV